MKTFLHVGFRFLLLSVIVVIVSIDPALSNNRLIDPNDLQYDFSLSGTNPLLGIVLFVVLGFACFFFSVFRMTAYVFAVLITLTGLSGMDHELLLIGVPILLACVAGTLWHPEHGVLMGRDVSNQSSVATERKPPREIAETVPNERSQPNSIKPKATKFFHRKLPKDASEIVRDRFNKAMAGDPEAQFLLGKNYEVGDGVEDHYIEAAGWYKESAEQGNPQAQFRLALLLKSGLGALKDLELAKKYAGSATSSGHRFTETEQVLLADLLKPTEESSDVTLNPANPSPNSSEPH